MLTDVLARVYGKNAKEPGHFEANVNNFIIDRKLLAMHIDSHAGSN